MMFLKNYTSDVPVHITIMRIEQVLITCGVTGIRKNYKSTKGDILSIDFQIETNSGVLTIQLPANVENAQDALFKNYAEGEPLTGDGRKFMNYTRKRQDWNSFRQQAERTAWKIMQDWVEVQMSMIQMKQAETLQVFMPYIYDGKQNFYQRVMADGGRMLQLTN